MTRTLAIALLLLISSVARADCPNPYPAQSPAGSACVLDPVKVCSNHLSQSCTKDTDCPDGDITVPDCPNNESNHETCITWPFVDRDSDGCFDSGEDQVLSVPAMDYECDRAVNGPNSDCTVVGNQRRCCNRSDPPLPVCCTYDFTSLNVIPKFQLVVETNRGGSCSGSGASCGVDADCTPPQTCKPGTCTGPVATPCALNADCSAGQTCVIHLASCNDTCDASAGKCRARPSQTCSTNADCVQGLTTPADLKCIDGTSFFKLGAPNPMQSAKTYFTVNCGGTFRNYAWGLWKNHQPNTRFFVNASNVVVGGYNPNGACVSGICVGGGNPGATCTVAGQCTFQCVANACVGGPNPGASCTSSNDCASFKSDIAINWDKDIQLRATAGCVQGGSFTGARNVNSIKMNAGDASSVLLLQAFPGKLDLAPGKWNAYGKNGHDEAQGCPLTCSTGDFNTAGSFAPEFFKCSTCNALYCRQSDGSWTATTCATDANCSAFVGATCQARPCRSCDSSFPGPTCSAMLANSPDCPASGDVCKAAAGGCSSP